MRVKRAGDFVRRHDLAAHRQQRDRDQLQIRDRERDADAMGFALYNLSWGWRDDVLDGAPLNQGPRILLGPLMFHLFIRWHIALRQGLMLVRLKSGETLNTDTIRGEVADAESRAKTTFAQLNAYERMIRDRGAKFTDQDSALIQMIAASGSAFALAIVRSALSIPEADLRIALDVSNVGF